MYYLFLFAALSLSAAPPVTNEAFQQQTILESASDLYEKKDYKSSLEHYQNFLNKYPKDVRKQSVQMMIAECLRELSYNGEDKADKNDELLFQDPKVVKEYEKVIKMDGNTALAESAQFRLIEMMYNTGSYNEAARNWDTFLDRYPDGYLKAEALFSQAQTLAMLNRWDELDQAINELLRVNPAYGEEDEVLYLSGIASFAKLLYQKGVDSFEKMAKQTPSSLYYSGKSYIGLAKPLVAVQKFQELLQNFPEDPLAEEGRYLLAEAYFAAGDYLSAIAGFEKFLQSSPKSYFAPAAAYKIGMSQYSRESYFEARTAFQNVLTNYPKSDFAPWSQYMVGETFLKQNQMKEASFAYGEMANVNIGHPFSGNALYKLAWCDYLDKNFQATEATVRKMLASYPGHALAPYANTLLGNALTKMERYQEASLSYQRAVDLAFPSDIAEAALSLSNRSMLYDKNFGALVSAHHLLLNNYPPSANPWRALTYLFVGEGYFRSGLYNEAINIYKSILRLYPTSPAAMYAQDGIAWALFKLDKPQEAGEERNKISTYQPTEEEGAAAPAYFQTNAYELANSLFNQKKYADALEKYDKFAKENSTHTLAPEALFRMGLCYSRLGYHGQAIDSWESLRKSYAESPASVKAAWKIADTYFRAAKYDSAIGIYRDLIQNHPEEQDIPFAKLRIAQGYYNSKQGPQAIEEFKNLILQYPDRDQAKESLEFLSSLLEQPQYKTPALAALRSIADSIGDKSNVGADAQFRIAQNNFDAKDYPGCVKELEGLSGRFLASKWLSDKEYYLGESYYQLNRFADTVSSFERMVKNFPESEKIEFALFRLGSSYFKLEKYSSSAEAFSRLARDFPRSNYAPNAIYNAAISYKKARRWEDAKTALSAYMRTYPDKAKESQAQEEMVNLHQETKDYNNAIALLEDLRKPVPAGSERYAELSVRVAENYVLSGNAGQAMAEYEKLLESLAPRTAWRLNASVKLVDLYEKNEKWKEAAKIYDDIVKNAQKPEWVNASKARLDFIRANHPEAFLK